MSWVEQLDKKIGNEFLYVGIIVFNTKCFPCASKHLHYDSSPQESKHAIDNPAIYSPNSRNYYHYYIFYRGNGFGPFSDFEFMLVLSFTELILVFLIIFSFFKYQNSQENEGSSIGTINWNIKDLRTSFGANNSERSIIEKEKEEFGSIKHGLSHTKYKSANLEQAQEY